MDRHAIHSANLNFEITNEQLSIYYTQAEILGSTSSKGSKVTFHYMQSFL
jgi:hypothetical protein